MLTNDNGTIYDTSKMELVTLYSRYHFFRRALCGLFLTEDGKWMNAEVTLSTTGEVLAMTIKEISEKKAVKILRARWRM